MAGETTCSHICSNWWSLYYRMDSWLCQYHFSRLGNCSSFFKEFLLPLWGCSYGSPSWRTLKLAAFLFAIYMVPTKVTKDSCLSLLPQVLASRLVKTSPIFFQICLMVFLYDFRDSWSYCWCCIISLALHILPCNGASPYMAFTSKIH